MDSLVWRLLSVERRCYHSIWDGMGGCPFPSVPYPVMGGGREDGRKGELKLGPKESMHERLGDTDHSSRDPGYQGREDEMEHR